MYKGFRANANGPQTIYLNGQPINGEWVYGHLLKIPYNENGDADCYIISNVDWRDNIYDIHRYAYDVFPETICEAIPGLKDSKGNQVYNHDIVDCWVIRNGGRYSNWEQIKNINHGRCRTLPMEFYYADKVFGECICGYSFRPTEEAKSLIKEYEKPVGLEKTHQHINWYNIGKDDLIAVVGTIFDKEPTYEAHH